MRIRLHGTEHDVAAMLVALDRAHTIRVHDVSRIYRDRVTDRVRVYVHADPAIEEGEQPDRHNGTVTDDQIVEVFDLGYSIGQADERRWWRAVLWRMVAAMDNGTIGQYAENAAKLADDVEQWLAEEGSNE